MIKTIDNGLELALKEDIYLRKLYNFLDSNYDSSNDQKLIFKCFVFELEDITIMDGYCAHLFEIVDSLSSFERKENPIESENLFVKNVTLFCKQLLQKSKTITITVANSSRTWEVEYHQSRIKILDFRSGHQAHLHLYLKKDERKFNNKLNFNSDQYSE